MKNCLLQKPFRRGPLPISDDELGDLRAKCEAQNRHIKFLKSRITFLELRLRQRIEVTENKFRLHEKDFTQVESLCLSIFRANPERRFTYEDFQTEYKKKYPTLPGANVPRRIRQLFHDGCLIREPCPETGKQTYCLKLLPLLTQ